MNKLIYGSLAVVLVLVVGLSAYFIVGRDKEEPPETVIPETNTSVPNTEQKAPDQVTTDTVSLSGIISEQKNQLCTFTDSETGAVGTVFIGDGNIRGDFQSDVNNQASVSHLVVLNSTDAYVWMEGETQGFTASLDGLTDLSEIGGEASALDINKAMDYECYPWTPDASQFELPETVQFQDMSSMLENASEFLNQ